MIGFPSAQRSNRLSRIVCATLLLSLASATIGASEPIELPVGQTRVFSLVFSPDGRKLAVGTGGQSPGAKIFDLATRKETLNIPCERRGAGFSLAFRPDGKQIAIADFDLTVTIRNPSDGTEIAALPGDPDRKTYRQARRVIYSPDGRTLIVGYSTGEVFLWDVEKNQVTTKFNHDHEITAIAISHDGKLIATGTDWGFRIWNFSDGKPVRSFDQKGSGSHEVKVIQFLPGHGEVATADNPGWLRKFSFDEGKETGAFKMPSVGATSTVYGVEVIQNGKLLISPGLMDGLDAKRPKLLQDGIVTIDAKTMQPQSFMPAVAARVFTVSPDGKTAALATGETDDPVFLYDLTQAKSLK